MAKVTVLLPRLLEPAVGGTRQLEINATTLQEAIDRLLERLPQLRVHLFDEERLLRPHVLCFLDGNGTRLHTNPRLVDGGEIRFLQAVSGGTQP